MIEDPQAEARATAELGYIARNNEVESALKWGFVAMLVAIPLGATLGLPSAINGDMHQWQIIVGLVAAGSGYARTVIRDRRWYRRVEELSRERLEG